MPDSKLYSSTNSPSPATATSLVNLSAKMTKLVNEKISARQTQERRHAPWNEIYELYRNRVRTNRLTQRQAVNVPLMKETIKTLLSKVDDPPTVNWAEKSGDDMKELLYQEIWETAFKDNNLEILDILDKKNVFLYGLSTKFLNLNEKGIDISVLDVYDVVFDPNMNPLDIESARFIIRQNIFKRLRDILVDERYTQSGRDKLKDWYASEKGLIQSGKNRLELQKKLERLKAMGLNSPEFAYFEGGDVVVNLSEHYSEIWNEKTKKFERHVIVQSDDMWELCDDLLIDCIGVTFWPFEQWYEDAETNDIYPDGIGDLVLTPNKIINAWFSQQTENRTLRNFQMHWFDSTIEGYQPQTYEPGPGRMLPAPGDPNKTIMPVNIDGLDDTLDAISYVINMVERGTGATAIEKGQSEQGVQTLGEIEIIAGKATERAKTTSKFYKFSWYRLCKKWDGMMQANDFGAMTLYKTGADGKVYEKKIKDSDWKSTAGFEPTVASSSEQEADELKSIQKFGFVLQQFPNNPALRRIAQQRQLKLLDLTPAELKEVEDAEKSIQTMQQTNMVNANATQPVQPEIPLQESIQQGMPQLQQ